MIDKPSGVGERPAVTTMAAIELLLRGAAAGVNLLSAGVILSSPAPRLNRYLGGLFVLGIVAYILISGGEASQFIEELEPALKIPALTATVVFWWFALALFDDDFRIGRVELAPMAALAFFRLPFSFWKTPTGVVVEQLGHSLLTIGLMAHVTWVALRRREDDLVGARRRFRVVFAIVVGVTAAIIAVFESLDLVAAFPDWLALFHAGLLAVLSFFFAFWMLSADTDLFAPKTVRETPDNATIDVPGPASGLTGADAVLAARLERLMRDGAYREASLTVARLAAKLGLPEHQLRRIINQSLGYRNFSAFLNRYRIAEAREILSDPTRAREQILTVALGLGYGSIAPFNRAFKAETGETPSAFRRNHLGRPPIVSENL